jgi:hypothetical protein
VRGTFTNYSHIKNTILFPGLATFNKSRQGSKVSFTKKILFALLPIWLCFVQYKRQEKSEYRLAFLLKFFTNFAKSAEDLPRPGNSE